MWFSRGIPRKCLNSGLGIIVCPDIMFPSIFGYHRLLFSRGIPSKVGEADSTFIGQDAWPERYEILWVTAAQKNKGVMWKTKSPTKMGDVKTIRFLVFFDIALVP